MIKSNYKIGMLTDYSFKWYWVESTTPLRALKEHVNNTEYVFDSDNCGSQDLYYAVGRDGKFVFYKVYHEWYWVDSPIENYLDNTFEYTEISEEEARKQVKNWLVV